MKFENGKQMYEYLISEGDLYSKSLGIYAFEYNAAHAICIYHLDPNEVAELVKRSKETNEYWAAFLGPGGSILDDEDYDEYRYVEDEERRALYLRPSLEFCEESFNAKDWIDTNDISVEHENIEKPVSLDEKLEAAAGKAGKSEIFLKNNERIIFE